MRSLKGRRALVTGGSRGIGAATARLLAEHGARVVIGCRSRLAEANAVASEIQRAGGDAHAFAADLSAKEGADSLFGRALDALGGLDIVVGNAGTWPTEAIVLARIPDARWRETLRHNLDGIFHTARLAAAHVADHGRIVLLSSTAGQRGEAMHADYAATKGAIISLVKSLAIELARRGITVNAVAPGWVDTEMAAAALAGSARAEIAQSIPLGRIATAEDIAGPIAFLCSGLARHVTGEVLNVNGGSVLCS